MDHGLITTIDLLIESFLFFPKIILVIILKNQLPQKLSLVVMKMWQPKVVSITTCHIV
jgi:hypothetical protein